MSGAFPALSRDTYQRVLDEAVRAGQGVRVQKHTTTTGDPMFVRRLSIVSGLAAATVALSAGGAFAHECYFTNPNPHAQAGRAGTPAFMSFHDMAEQYLGLCEVGIDQLAAAGNITPDTLINTKGMMAGPTDGNKAIRHLDFAAIDEAVPGALEACGML